MGKHVNGTGVRATSNDAVLEGLGLRTMNRLNELTRAVKPGRKLLTRITPSGELLEGKERAAYTIEKLYKHHFICALGGIRRSFTYTDLLTGRAVLR